MGSPYGMLMNEDENTNSRTTKSPPAPAGIPANLLAMLGGSGAKAVTTEAAKSASADQG